MSFDAWGQRRNATSWQALTGTSLTQFDTSATTRGYTGHEMLDAVGVVHMNGRIYDAKLGRVLQADPLVQDALNTQSLNRYSYVLNNPLNATDPSGYLAFLPALIAIGSSFAGAALIAKGLVLAGLATAFAGGALATLVGGGNLRDALISGVSAAAFAYVGGGFDWATATWGEVSVVALKFGAIGGVTSLLQGDKFGNGFISAGASAFVGKLLGPSTKFGKALGPGGRAITRIIVGGTISEATGGKFKNGAAYAALSAAIAGAFTSETDSSQNSGASSSQSPQKQPNGFVKGLTVAVDIIGKVWNLPNTVLGFTVGMVGHVVGRDWAMAWLV